MAGARLGDASRPRRLPRLLRLLSLAGRARQGGGHHRPPERRPLRARHRRGLERGRVARLRHALPGASGSASISSRRRAIVLRAALRRRARHASTGKQLQLAGRRSATRSRCRSACASGSAGRARSACSASSRGTPTAGTCRSWRRRSSRTGTRRSTAGASASGAIPRAIIRTVNLGLAVGADARRGPPPGGEPAAHVRADDGLRAAGASSWVRRPR